MDVTRVARRHPLVCYFTLAYLLTGIGLLVVGLPRLHGSGERPTSSLVMFPVMVVGVGAVGLALTALVEGKAGLARLRGRLTLTNAGHWLPVLAVPPLAILLVLGVLTALVSPQFTPQVLVFGVPAGLLAGLCEELGWTGFAYPRLRRRLGSLGGALVLGLLWGLWHLPVVDSLGAASPHGAAWPAFFASFVAVVTALRVLICWIYDNTSSLLLAQLLHASSTGFLVVLGAPRVTPGQEALWYALYAAVLALVGLVAVSVQGRALGPSNLAPRRSPSEAQAQAPGQVRRPTVTQS